MRQGIIVFLASALALALIGAVAPVESATADEPAGNVYEFDIEQIGPAGDVSSDDVDGYLAISAGGGVGPIVALPGTALAAAVITALGLVGLVATARPRRLHNLLSDRASSRGETAR